MTGSKQLSRRRFLARSIGAAGLIGLGGGLLALPGSTLAVTSISAAPGRTGPKKLVPMKYGATATWRAGQPMPPLPGRF